MTDKEIIRLENLSKLELTDGEREKIKGEIEEIIEYFNLLKEADVTGVEPVSHSGNVKNVFREDEVKPSLDVNEITKNGVTENSFFVVPVSVEGENG